MALRMIGIMHALTSVQAWAIREEPDTAEPDSHNSGPNHPTVDGKKKIVCVRERAGDAMKQYLSKVDKVEQNRSLAWRSGGRSMF